MKLALALLAVAVPALAQTTVTLVERMPAPVALKGLPCRWPIDGGFMAKLTDGSCLPILWVAGDATARVIMEPYLQGTGDVSQMCATLKVWYHPLDDPSNPLPRERVSPALHD
jgi:hypothetical protein